ncbi:fructan 6-exohydrolase-like [Papaver somniferum]|uniref:fructan 6-exohydrolase-like n=1 Tax=Papaver somniferum TaxID=3469 RepID=UPI000E6FD55C|nr:fructan 6-exohydrolase-like [Papaver somniferum]
MALNNTVNHHGVEASQTFPGNLTQNYQPYRTGYHFQPSNNWMNDPNGPMIYNGIYHLFYQWRTLTGLVWSKKVWAHATSTDLVNWIHHKHAIVSSEPFDIESVWSGSTTFVQGKPIIQYTGIIKTVPWKYQVQNMAVPKDLSDPYLIEWIKPVEHNPVIKPTDDINSNAFRDPTTGWQGPDGIWRITIGSKVGNDGVAFLYRSADFIHWIKAEQPLHSAKESGMWECPDFFPVAIEGKEGVDTSVLCPSVKHVFKVSFTSHEYYTIGSYNPETDTYTPDEGSIDNDSGLRFDYGKFYASKTFFDNEKNRRVLWGWVNESSSVADDVKKGWSGLQALPRTLWLSENSKQLKQWPVEEIKQLRTERVSLPSQVLAGGSVMEVPGVTASQADVDVIFELPKLEDCDIMDPNWVAKPQLLCSLERASVPGKSGPFGLLASASKNFEEQTAIFFRVFNHQNNYVVFMCSDQSRSSLEQSNDKTTYGAFIDFDPKHDKLSLRSLIDHSAVQSFGVEGKAVITARVYPKLAVDNEALLYVFNNGTENLKMSSLEAWSMKKAEIKYLEDLKISKSQVQRRISVFELLDDQRKGGSPFTFTMGAIM